MPTSLPPRVPESEQRDEVSTALILTIAVLALLVVMAEARALGGSDWTFRLPRDRHDRSDVTAGEPSLVLVAQ